MSEEQAFREAMQGREIGADSRGRVLHFEPFEDAFCEVCGAKDHAGDQVELDARGTTLRVCPECR